MKPTFKLEANGSFFEVCLETKSQRKLNREVRCLKKIHQGEIKRLTELNKYKLSFAKIIDSRCIARDLTNLKITIIQI
jgi:hypothetical protein